MHVHLCEDAYLHANSSGAGWLLIWFEFRAFVVHGITCAAHSRLAGRFSLQINVFLKTHIRISYHINSIIITIINVGPNLFCRLNDIHVHIHEMALQGT